MRTRAERGMGFTLIEVLVTLGVMMTVFVGLLTMLDSAGHIAKQEAGVAGAQAAGRSGLFEVSRIIRQASVGKLSCENAILPYVNNAPPGRTVTDISGVVHTLREGTDAIEARGTFRSETDFFGPTDVTCGGAPCTGNSNAVTVTIQQRAPQGFDNYISGGKPAAGNRTRDFYYVVATTVSQSVAAGANLYSTPLYFVGRVSPQSVTQTATATSFVLDFTDAGARALNATSVTAAALQKPFLGGVVDDIVFFVDRGNPDPVNPLLFLHPAMVEAIRDPASGRFDVQPVVAEVEDFQVAYGIDGADGSVPDRGVDPVKTSRVANGDEWVFDAAGESLTVQNGPVRVEAFLDSSVPSVLPSLQPARPALKAILLSFVVKSAEPDLRFDGSGAWGLKPLDSTAISVSSTVNRPYRRRAQTMAVTLRNYL